LDSVQEDELLFLRKKSIFCKEEKHRFLTKQSYQFKSYSIFFEEFAILGRGIFPIHR
jgi:hypothetical protein